MDLQQTNQRRWIVGYLRKGGDLAIVVGEHKYEQNTVYEPHALIIDHIQMSTIIWSVY